jgi:ribosome maturation factor RimP
MGWAQLIFFWSNAKLAPRMNGKLGELLASTLPPMGYELVDWEMSRGRMVRVFIDKLAGGAEGSADGISVDDCARVSNHLTRLFTVEDIDYERLEVSSPGLDRPLTKIADYTRFSGEEAQVHLHELTDGVRKLKGILRGIEGQNVLVETESGVRTIPFALIDRGRLVPKIEWRKAK